MRTLLKIKIAVVIVFLMTAYSANAQNLKVSWGDNTKLKYDFDDAVQLGGGKMLILKLKDKTYFGGKVTITPIPHDGR